MRTALITGANRGIGLAIAKRLVELDYKVIGTTRKSDYPKIEGMMWLVCDVTNATQVSMAANAYGRCYPSLDVLINNAAIMEDTHDILNTPIRKMQEAMVTNAFAPLHVSQLFWKYLKLGHGKIINISSTDSFCEDEHRPAYAVSKAALNAITKKLSLAGLKDGISVNACCPSWCRTGMGGDNAPRSAEEGADTPVWMANELSHSITGKFFKDRKEIEPLIFTKNL